MRKYCFVFLLLLSVGANAQWVSIPDTNFGTWLNTNGYSACLQGNNSIGCQLDTACSAVVNEDTIDCSFGAISNLTGIQYFDNLKLLGCSNNQLVGLSILPHGLTWLGCSDNQLSGLPTLPNSLIELYCSNNQITSLPALPSGLVWLFCDGNQISNLPTLPSNLECTKSLKVLRKALLFVLRKSAMLW